MLDFIYTQVTDIQELGLEPAIFLHYLRAQINNKRTDESVQRDGRTWINWTAKRWARYFGIWSEHQVTRIIRKLEKAGAIIKGFFSSDSSDRTMWIAPAEDIPFTKPKKVTKKSKPKEPVLQDRKMATAALQETADRGDVLDTGHFAESSETPGDIAKCSNSLNKEDLNKNTFLERVKEKRSKGTAKVVSPEERIVTDIASHFGVGFVRPGQQGQWRDPDLVDSTKSLVRRLTGGDLETLELFWSYLYENNRAIPLGVAYPWKQEFDTFLSERERYKAAS